MAVAKKAVWIAGKTRDAVRGDAVRLTLFVDSRSLTWANRVGMADDDGAGGKARHLAGYVLSQGVVLTVEHVPFEDNLAEEVVAGDGLSSWAAEDLSTLIERLAQEKRASK